MKPKNMPRPISVNAVGKPSMMTTTMSPSIDKPSAASVMRTSSCDRPRARPRRFIDLLGALDHVAARFLVDIGAAGKLLLDDVHLLGVLQPRWPGAAAQADDAAHDLGQALQHDDRAG